MRNPSISELVERRSVLLVEATIPPHMTMAEWRRGRRAVPRSRLHLARATARRALQRV